MARPKKDTKVVPGLDRTIDHAVSTLGEQPGKSAAAKLLGKAPATPNSGRLNKDGETPVKTINVAPTEFKILALPIVGKEGSSLIVHNWSAKAFKEILAKQMGFDPKLFQGRKDAFQEFLGSLYKDRLTGEMQIRSIMFKASMLECIRMVPGVNRKDAMQGISIIGEFAPLYGMPTNRLDAVKIGPWNDRVSDLRFRAEYHEWMTILHFKFDPKLISEEAIVNLLDKAGTIVGVGDWRPDKGGTSGTFEVLRGGQKAMDAMVKRLGRFKLSDLTPENTGTLTILSEIGLDPESLKKLSQIPSSPGPGAQSNGVGVEVQTQ
jgi:hypothetical protein